MENTDRFLIILMLVIGTVFGGWAGWQYLEYLHPTPVMRPLIECYGPSHPYPETDYKCIYQGTEGDTYTRTVTRSQYYELREQVGTLRDFNPKENRWFLASWLGTASGFCFTLAAAAFLIIRFRDKKHEKKAKEIYEED